jgi:methylenetetrahydrofolate reductase (NADPH)
MRLSQIWQMKRPTLSFEFFPARTPEGATNLERVIDQLYYLEPDFVGITFGAGGSTREGSRQLVDKLHNDKELELLAYFAGYGLPPDYIESILEDYQALGVENLLVVRGDPPHGQPDFVPHPQSFAHASDLLTFIKPEFPFCLGVAGYPEGHIEAESKDKDLEYLKKKVDLGAEFIITNYFYDNRFFFDFMDRCLAQGIQVPILPGIMPVFSLKMMRHLANLCGATITDKLEQGLVALPEGDQRALLNFGIDFAAAQCRELLQAGVVGLHFYTMDRSQATTAVVSRLRLEGIL